MSFWDLPDSRKTALVREDAAPLSYRELLAQVMEVEAMVFADTRHALGMLFFDPSVFDIGVYLASLRSANPALLLNASMDPSLAGGLIEHYRPAWILAPKSLSLPACYGAALAGEAKALYLRKDSGFSTCHPELALLLTTSGSTGSPKLVRLSRGALQANAESIRSYLGIQSDTVAVTSLPLFYSYGLSVLNSHLLAEASIGLTSRSLLDKVFYAQLKDWRVTSLAGVPFHYKTLVKTGFFRDDWPDINTLTQAGGRLDARDKQLVHEYARQKQKRFYVMYGQTEATARMCYVPPAQLGDKLDSIGIPIPDGKMECDRQTGELVYQGPNVMMGYATRKEHLLEGDVNRGVLHTGDIGRIDDDGYFYVMGRESRFIKLAGQRLALDDIEQKLAGEFHCNIVAVGDDDSLKLVLEAADHELSGSVEQRVKTLFGLSPSLYKVCLVDHLPIKDNGKLDLPLLRGMCA